MEEIWLDIKGYEGIYQVSNKGKVRSLDREVEHWNGFQSCKRKVKGVELKGSSNGIGYIQVQLTTEGICKKKYIHRLVIETFTGESYLDVNHIDHNKTNNSLCNLEYVTKKDNTKKMVEYYSANKKPSGKIIKDRSKNRCTCGRYKVYDSLQCKHCYCVDKLVDGTINKPTLGTLLKSVYSIGYKGTGRVYNVSDNTIRKWIVQWHKLMDE